MASHRTGRWFKTRLVRYFLSSFQTDYHIDSIACAVVCGGSGRISRSSVTKDIKMGSCVFQCDVPHQWIAQRQGGPVSVYCDWEGYHALSLPHDISVWQHIGQDTTATSRHRRDLTSNV